MGRGIEGKKDSLAKQNDPKQNYSSPANLKYKPRVLMAANNNVYRTIRKKVFAVSISTNRVINSIILYSSETLHSFNNSTLIQ